MTSRRNFLFHVTGAAFALSVSRNAQAHARLVRSRPGKDETLKEPPKEIELWFNELLDDKFNTIELVNADAGERKNLLSEKPAVNPKDRTHLLVKVPELKPGSYIVEYRVLSRDGHTAPGRFRFRVAEKRPD